MTHASSEARNTHQLLERFNDAQSKLVVQTADLPLGTLAEMVAKGAIDLTPGFQRRERWKPEKQSALIESFLLNVPVPPVYLAEEQSGTYTAIDGKQRLKAIADFIKNVYSLKSLERVKEAEGLFFDELPGPIQNALTIRPSLRVVTLLKQTDPSLKYEVFLRLNKGGELLNNQEIRNVAFRGITNDAIYDLAKNDFLRARLKIVSHSSSAYRNMSDAEYVLRFLTLDEKYENFSGSFVDEMNDFMRRHQVGPGGRVGVFKDKFNQAILKCAAIWGDIAFKRAEKGRWRDQFLAGMYDAQMLACSRIDDSAVSRAQSDPQRVEELTKRLFDDDNFDVSVRAGTNTPGRIKYRVEKVKHMLQTV